MTVTIAERHKPRNISVHAVLDKDRADLLEELARGMGITKSLAVNHLIDLHAGVLVEEIAKHPVPRFEPERARARKLTGELIVDVASLVREGMTQADAYRRCGVNARTAATWMKRGRDDRDADKGGLHADLVVALDQARAEFNHELIQEARRKGDYKTLLKLLDPEQFSPVSRSQVDVTHRWQLLIDWSKLTIEKAKLLRALLIEASPLEDDPAVTRTARPALEAIPQEIADLVDAEDGEWTEAPLLEAPALEKPEH